MRKWIVGAALVGVAGCTPPSDAANAVREAALTDVAACTELGRVTGIPGVYGPLAQVGLNDARNVAKRTAAAQGANTVVFDQITPGDTAYEVKGTAYSC